MEGSYCLFFCFGSDCKESNKEPKETKCSLKQLKMADLSVIVDDSFIIL